MVGRLRLLLAVLCLVGLVLIVGYSEIARVLRLSLLQSTICSITFYKEVAFSTQYSLAHEDNVASTPTSNTSAAWYCSGSNGSATLSAIPLQLDISQEAAPSPIKQWHANKFWHMENTFPLCSMDSCFNFSRCANMEGFRIYAYGPPYEPLAYLAALNSSPWLTTNASEACLFLATMRTHHASTQLPHLTTLPHWNGGLNHVIATLADKWSLTAPPPHSIGNASVLASCLYETTHRPGFDVSIPLAGKTHLTHLQSLKPWSRKYFLTFKGTRYLGHTEGNFRSDPAMLAMHNGKDVIVAVTCNQVTNQGRGIVSLSTGSTSEMMSLLDYDHMIELLPPSTPPNKPPYRVPQAQQEEIMRQVIKLVEEELMLTLSPHVFAKHFAFMAKVAQDIEPTCFEEVVENDKWQEALKDKMDALYGNETWELVPLPKIKKPIGCKWVYKVKHNSDGSASRYKATLVAKGYAQTYGIDYEETFASLAKMATVRAIIVVATANGWILHQMDVKNAFSCDLQEEVYMEQPPGFQDTTPQICM
ncbi:hypothetical protein L7F22_022077 [Adiantum nelumboides]|nr:hypothetical protein [Adiantum nelumboides]